MNAILIGGGKFAGLIISMFSDTYKFIGYIDDIYENAYVKEIYSTSYIGKSEDIIKNNVTDCNNVIISIGSEGDTSVRKNYFNKFLEAGFNIPYLIHPTANVANNSIIGDGTIVQINAVIHPMVRIGKNCVISTNAIIGHDSIIGNNVYIAPGVIINGSVVIGDNTFVGTGATIIQKTVVGNNCIIGASSCVNKDIPDNSKVVGVPIKFI